MIDAMLHALSPYLLLVTLGGVVLGIFWGAMPGLSTTMAMMLLIGLSVGMKQDVALAFMLGVYTAQHLRRRHFGGVDQHSRHAGFGADHDRRPCAGQEGPGRSGARAGDHRLVPRQLGRHPAAGQRDADHSGDRAAIPSWEMFLLAVIGISICGSMTSGSIPLKGWITGWIGMMLAFVGYDAIHGVARFTYDIPALFDGISYVAILIGMFGLAEIMKVLPQSDKQPMPENVGRAIPSVGLLIKHMPAALRSGLLGTVIGAIPGAGANIAAFLAYDVGRRRAPPEEQAKWGKGSYEGIVCSEVANNANIGGSMLPTLTLGIPGSAPAAALMAALQLKNVSLGPTIDIDQPGLIQLIYALLIVANFLMFGAAIALIKPCVKLFSLPRGLLMTLIIPICIIGAFAVRTNMSDVWVMVAGGFIGYAFYMFKFPAAPVVLGVILAPLADENLRRSLLLFDNNGLGFFAKQYVGHVLIAVIVFVFIEGIRRGRRTRREAAAAAQAASA